MYCFRLEGKSCAELGHSLVKLEPVHQAGDTTYTGLLRRSQNVLIARKDLEFETDCMFPEFSPYFLEGGRIPLDGCQDVNVHGL